MNKVYIVTFNNKNRYPTHNILEVYKRFITENNRVFIFTTRNIKLAFTYECNPIMKDVLLDTIIELNNILPKGNRLSLLEVEKDIYKNRE